MKKSPQTIITLLFEEGLEFERIPLWHPKAEGRKLLPIPQNSIPNPSRHSGDTTKQRQLSRAEIHLVSTRMNGHRSGMKRSNSDIVYDYVRKNILEGKFPPGYSLQANDLANKTGVSRTPVKDALRQLETDGLVVIQNRIGARVRTMEEKEFRELCELRLALEGYAAGLAARNRTLADLNEINAALQTMITTTDKLAELADSESLFSELLHGDLRFHITIISAAKNETIKSQILQLHVINRVMARPVPVQRRGERWTASLRETIRSHTAIFEAIKAGNVTEARARMEEHIQEVIDDHTRVSSPPAATGFRELTDEEMNYMALLPH